MYSEADLQSAVASGALSREAAQSLRDHVNGIGNAPVADEEHFRLVTGFNDIFVTIAAVLLLVACAGIGNALMAGMGGLLVAVAAWGMAEFFTRLRRMALPLIVLLLAFVGGVAAIPIEVIDALDPKLSDQVATLTAAAIALLAGGAAMIHWRRFMVPITIAAGTAALAVAAIALLMAAIQPLISRDTIEQALLPLIFIAGIGVFGFAMRWDTSDRSRETRRSDVAFWLHLLAAPMIAHPLFHWLGVTQGANIGAAAALGVVAIYAMLGLVALAVDRRALLVSALVYVLTALTLLFREFGMVELNVAVTGLVIGSALLCLSAFWGPIRRAVVRPLPGGLQGMLPATA